MTKRPNKKYWRPIIYLPPDLKDDIERAARQDELSVSSWVKMLIEERLGIDTGTTPQVHHGQSTRRKTP